MSILEDEFGDIIAKARAGAGCTVDQIAESTRVPVSDIQKMESYQLLPSREQTIRLAHALSLDSTKLTEIMNDSWHPQPLSFQRENVVIEQISVPYGTSNCYVIGCTKSGIGGVVDPGGAVDEILRLLAEHNLNLELVLITHSHADHISGLKQLISAWPGARVVSNSAEKDRIMHEVSARWEPANECVAIHLGDLTLTALDTPGHTPGSTCYTANGICFTGDTLFAGSIGQPVDWKVYPKMLSSIRDKVLSMPGNTIILPGHGPATTAGEENAHNPFF
ncbi:MAG: MBL fold metallo-hydrolase [Armatimonadota bacterium]|nr:MBL fold metallo-hydrolase [bacterium]